MGSYLEGDSELINWRLSAYRNDIDELIGYNDKAKQSYNIGKARIKGVEWTGNFDTGPVNHQLVLSYTDPRNSRNNKVLTRRAKQQINYQLDWQIGKLDWTLNYHYLGKRYDEDFSQYPAPRIKMGGVSLWDIAAGYQITSHLSVRARIANLLDKNYQTAYGYRKAGREYFLTTTYKF